LHDVLLKPATVHGDYRLIENRRLREKVFDDHDRANGHVLFVPGDVAASGLSFLGCRNEHFVHGLEAGVNAVLKSGIVFHGENSFKVKGGL
jgi:hypothetical protein